MAAKSNTAVAERPQTPAKAANAIPAQIEQVLVNGDLAQLQPNERVSYYNAVCESLGLNPLTKPFDYIKLNGRLRLYATRECAEQLRKINGISLEIKDRGTTEGVYSVVARAWDKEGRQDEATGAVFIGQSRGENLANALMKAETKAKRRVTLSISGLSFMDTTEAGDIPGGQFVNYDVDTGEIHEPAGGRQPANPTAPPQGQPQNRPAPAPEQPPQGTPSMNEDEWRSFRDCAPPEVRAAIEQGSLKPWLMWFREFLPTVSADLIWKHQMAWGNEINAVLAKNNANSKNLEAFLDAQAQRAQQEKPNG